MVLKFKLSFIDQMGRDSRRHYPSGAGWPEAAQIEAARYAGRSTSDFPILRGMGPRGGSVLQVSSSEKAKPRSATTAAANKAEQCGCGRDSCGDEKRSPSGIQSLLSDLQRFPLGMPR